jgi:tRNA (cytidine/uridine-2'-O-)-methyltransferase
MKNFSLRLALYQPDMPPNTGTMMRMCACLGVGLDIIEPCGFPMDDAKLRRAAMDYIDHLDYARHASWDAFQAQTGARRIILLSTKAAMPYTDFTFHSDDILMVGRESAGVPDDVHNSVDARILVPMQPPLRSLNVAISAAMVVGEAVRQINFSK